MSKTKKILITIGLSLLVGLCLFGIVLCVTNLIDNHSQYAYSKYRYVPDSPWIRILKNNISLLYVVLLILLVNFTFIIYNIIIFIKHKRLIWGINKYSLEEKKRLEKIKKQRLLENKKTKLMGKIKVIEKEQRDG